MLFLVRHAETDRYLKKISQGWANNPINDNGIAQTEICADKVQRLKIAHFFSSDLLRSKQTADILNKKLKMNIIYDARLREINSGSVEGKIKTELPEDFIADYKKNPHKYGAESQEDVFNRARSFIDHLASKNIDNALIVTHGGFIRLFRFALEQKDWDTEKYATKKYPRVAHSEVIELDFSNHLKSDKDL